MATSSRLVGRGSRPGVAVDLAILTVVGSSDTNPELRVVVQDRDHPNGPALSGGFIRERATVAETVADVLARKIGITPDDEVPPRLLRVFDDPARDDRTWAISIAHSASAPESVLAKATGDLVPATANGRLEGVDRLLFDHDPIVANAIEAVRERYEIRYRYVDVHPDPDGFLPEPFTLHRLRKVQKPSSARNCTRTTSTAG